MPESRRLSDAEIAEAMLAASQGDTVEPACPGDDRYWELTCGALGADEAGHLLDHAAACAACGLALRGAHEVFDASKLTVNRPSLGARLWSLLGSTVLRPAPALAYLLLLALGIPASRFLSGPGNAILRDTRIVRVRGDVLLRGGEESVPLRLPMAGTGAPVLELLLDADKLRAARADTVLRVRLFQQDTVVAEIERPVSQLDEAGSVAIALDRAGVQPGITYRVEVVIANEPPFFRQSFRVDPGPERR